MTIDSRILRLRASEVLMCFVAGYLIGKYSELNKQLERKLAVPPAKDPIVYVDGVPAFKYDYDGSAPAAKKEDGNIDVQFVDGGLKVNVDSKDLFTRLFKKG